MPQQPNKYSDGRQSIPLKFTLEGNMGYPVLFLGGVISLLVAILIIVVLVGLIVYAVRHLF